MRIHLPALLPLLLTLSLPASAQETYQIDATHSHVGFKVRHLVSKVSGRFTRFTGTIKAYPAEIGKSSVEVTIDAASINTDSPARDKHLRGSDFFAVDRFPTITFKSTAVREPSKGRLEITGLLTIRGVTRQVTFPITSAGTRESQPGKVVAGFLDGTLRINRMDYGLTYGSALIGEDVDIELDMEALKQPSAPPEAHK